eukprot:1394828-Pyramimonas_sp.AAC.1
MRSGLARPDWSEAAMSVTAGRLPHQACARDQPHGAMSLAAALRAMAHEAWPLLRQLLGASWSAARLTVTQPSSPSATISRASS